MKDKTLSSPNLFPRKWKAFSLERVQGGWSFVTVHFEDDKATKIERSEPDIKMLILEQFKIAAFKYWTNEAPPVFAKGAVNE